MADKKIIISAGLDTSAFDRSIEQLKQKMNGLNVGSTSNPNVVSGSNAYVESLQQKRRSDVLEKAGWGSAKVGDQSTKNVESERLKLLKQIDTEHNKELSNRQKIEDVLGKLKKREEDINKVIQERKKLGQDVVDQEEKLQKVKEQSKNRENAVKESEKREQILAEQKIYLTPESEKDRKRRPSQAIGSVLEGNPLREGASMLAAFAPELAALYAGIRMLKDFQGMTVENITSKGRTTQQAAEMSGRNIFDKTLPTDLYYGKEKQESLERSDLNFSEKYLSVSAAKAFGGRALGGAIRGLTLGQYDPTERVETAREEELKQAQMEKGSGVYKGLIEQGFLKKEGLEAWQKTAERNLPTQRALGISDSQMLSGEYITGGQKAGFETTDTMRSSQRILAAGGTSASGRDLATSANVLERDARLSNAQEMLGKLSGTGMKSKDSEDLLLKIFKKGTAEGVDLSKFAQENKKYMEATTDIVRRLGATDQGSGLDIEKTLSAFVDRTSGEREQEAGKTAYQAFQEMSRSGSGPQNLQRQVNMGNKFKKLSGEEIVTLSTMSDEALSAKGALVQSMASAAGYDDVDQFVKDAKEQQEKSQTVTKELERKRLSLKKKYGSPEQSKKMEEDIKSGSFKDEEWASFVSGLHQTDRGMSGLAVGSPEETRYAKAMFSGKMRTEEEKKIDEEEQSKLPMSGLMQDHQKAAAAQMERVSNIENIKALDPINKAIRDVEGASVDQLRSMLKIPEATKKATEGLDDITGGLIRLINAIQENSSKLKNNPLNFNGLPGYQPQNSDQSLPFFQTSGNPVK